MFRFCRMAFAILILSSPPAYLAQAEISFSGATMGYSEQSFVAAGQPLEFILAVQNNGPGVIQNITLSCGVNNSIVDISTIAVINSSHPVTLNVSDNGAFSLSAVAAGLVPDAGEQGLLTTTLGLATFSAIPHLSAVEVAAGVEIDGGPPVVLDPVSYTVFDCSSFSGISGQTEYCEGSQIELHTDDQYVESYTWYLNGEPWGNSDLLMIPSFPAMDYLISLELSNPLCTYTDEVVVTVSPSPVVIAGEDVTICEGETAEISAASDYTVAWNNGAGNGNQVNVSPQTSTLYTATSVNEYGCSGFDQQWVLVTGLPDNTVSENNGWLTASDADFYQWFLNGSPLDGANDQSLFVEESGYYSVVITNGTDCSVTSEEVFVVSVHEWQKPGFTVYPNPAQDGIRLDLPHGTWAYFICDNLGRTVRSGLYNRGEIIETSMLVSGCYSVVVTGDNSLLSTSFLITR